MAVPDNRKGPAKRADAESGTRFGCHVDGELSHDCVIDEGDRYGCSLAKERKSKWTCPWWAPVGAGRVCPTCQGAGVLGPQTPDTARGR